jgi:hypothetical protein
MSNAADRIIVALDGMAPERALGFAAAVPELRWVKVGLELFVAVALLVQLVERLLDARDAIHVLETGDRDRRTGRDRGGNAHGNLLLRRQPGRRARRLCVEQDSKQGACHDRAKNMPKRQCSTLGR